MVIINEKISQTDECPKCQCPYITVDYRPAVGDTKEHLHITCPKCGYEADVDCRDKHPNLRENL